MLFCVPCFLSFFKLFGRQKHTPQEVCFIFRGAGGWGKSRSGFLLDEPSDLMPVASDVPGIVAAQRPQSILGASVGSLPSVEVSQCRALCPCCSRSSFHPTAVFPPPVSTPAPGCLNFPFSPVGRTPVKGNHRPPLSRFFSVPT